MKKQGPMSTDDMIDTLRLLDDKAVTGGAVKLLIVEEPHRYSVALEGRIGIGPFECRWHPDDVARWKEGGTTHYMDADKRRCARALLVRIVQLAIFETTPNDKQP